VSHRLRTIAGVATTTTWVRCGEPAAAGLLAAVQAAKQGRPLAPVTVVVPSNHVGVATRRLLASGRLGPVCAPGVGLAAVTFATAYRVAELLGAPLLADRGRRPVSTPVVAAAVRAALAEHDGVFTPVAEHPATEAALVAAHRELRTVEPRRVAALAARGRRAQAVLALARATRARLAAAWYDEDDLLGAAVEALEAGAGADLGAIVVHLPQRTTPGVARLLRALAATRDVRIVAATTGHPAADAEVAEAVAQLDPAAPPPPAVLDPLDGLVDAARTRVVLTADADDEVRAAVRAVLDAVAAGTPLDRIAVLHASPSPYARLVADHLAAAGVPTNGTAVVPLAGHVAGRTLLALLAWPEDGLRRRDLFALLAGAPSRHRGRRMPLGTWERIARDAGVVAGADQWDTRLAAFADGRDALAERAAAAGDDGDADVPGWQAERARADAAAARELRGFALGLVAELRAARATPQPWPERAAWARRLLARVVGDERDRGRWPQEEARAAERVDAALDRLGALGAVEGPVGLEVFARTLAVELADDLARSGRLGEGVLVGTIGLATGLDLDLVVVLGLAEGSFPATLVDDSLLPDADRAVLGLPERRARVERQHRQLLAALAGARRHVLCAPRGDLRRSTVRVPSRWLLDVAGHLAGAPVRSDELAAVAAPWLDHVPSFDGGLRRAPTPATAQEHRLRTQLALGVSTTGDARVAAGLEVLAARRSRAFTRFDGNLAGLAVPSPVERATSATRLEAWAGCPFAYFQRHVLRVPPVEDPDDELRITPVDKGNLVHEVLEAFLLEVLARPEPPGPDDAWTVADRERLAAIADERCAAYEAQGQVGRALFWRRDRAALLRDLQQVLDADDEARRRWRTRPVAAELPFGGRGRPEVAIALPDGRAVRFTGKADRVDLAEDGTLHVLDYKSGSARSYQGLGEDDPVVAGRHLQLLVYAEAARVALGRPGAPTRADYWFVSSKGRFERIGYAVTDDVLARVQATMATVVGGIEAGAFPPHPDASTTTFFPCPACDPDRLGVADLRRAWERKRADPALARYADLAEPLHAATDDDLDAEAGDG
jgi:RecB family exonuclease